MSDPTPAEREAYAASLGVTPEYIAKAERAYLMGQVELSQLAGVSPAELQALYLHGYQTLRAGDARRAGRLFLSLIHMDRRAARGYVGLGQAFQAMHEFAWAQAVFEEALRVDPGHRIAKLLHAEMTALVDGKQLGAELLRQGIAMGPRDPDDAAFIERAKALLVRLAPPAVGRAR